MAAVSAVMERLPFELLIYFIMQLRNDHTALNALSLVCHSFRSEAQRFLFQSVSFPRGKVSQTKLHDIHAFLLHLSDVSNPIPTYIRTICSDLSVSVYNRLPKPDKLLVQALCAMPNLLSLKASRQLALAELSRTAPFKLRHLDTDGSLRDGFEDFVCSQPSLTSIRWSSPSEPPDRPIIFNTEDLPHLTMLRVEYDHWAKAFLPQCQLTHVNLQRVSDFRHLGLATSVRAMMLDGGDVDSGQLATIAEQFPNLEFLDVCLNVNPTSHDLKPFHRLKKLKIWATSIKWLTEPDCLDRGCELLAATSILCLDFVARRAQNVRVARMRQVPGGTGPLHIEMLEDIGFDECDEELWRWAGEPE